MNWKDSEVKTLIEKVTSEVFDSLKLNEEASKSLLDKNVCHPILILMPKWIVNPESYLKHLMTKHKNASLVLGRESSNNRSLEKWGKVYNIGKQECEDELLKGLNNYEFVYYIAPTISSMEKIIFGDDSNFIENVIIYALTHSKNVKLVIDYKFEDLKFNKLSQKIKNLINELKSIGIEFESIKDDSLYLTTPTEKEKALITQRDIEELWGRGEVSINCAKSGLITPLAKERAKELGIKIDYRY